MSAEVDSQQPQQQQQMAASGPSQTQAPEPEGELIRVHIHDSHASSTTLKIDPTTTAEKTCATLAAKLKVPLEQVHNFVLVLVVSTMRGGSVFSLLHTLQPKELLLESRENERQKMITKLKDEDDVPDNELEALQTSIRWYFKDSRLAPIELQGEVSGGSDSEDEHTCSEFDVRYLAANSGERNGYLLRRSKKDPNLWRKRYCVLTDKMWCIRTRGNRKVSSYINLADTDAVELPASSGVPYAFVVQNTHRNTGTQFRADSRSTQQGWVQDINRVCALTSENELIQLAEIIICDEESTRAARMHRSIGRVLDSKSVQHNLSGAMRMKSPSVQTLGRRHNGAAAALSFLVAVQRYKETFRHELRYTSEQQWRAACQVFVDHVRGELIRYMEAQKKNESAKTPTVVDSPFTLPALVRVHSILYNNVTYSVAAEHTEDESTVSSEGEQDPAQENSTHVTSPSTDESHVEKKREDSSVLDAIIPFFKALTFGNNSPSNAKLQARTNGGGRGAGWSNQDSMSEEEFEIDNFPAEVLALLPEGKGSFGGDLNSYRARLGALLREMQSSWLLTEELEVALGLRMNAVPSDPSAIAVVAATSAPREIRFHQGPPPIGLFDELTEQISANLDVREDLANNSSPLAKA